MPPLTAAHQTVGRTRARRRCWPASLAWPALLRVVRPPGAAELLARCKAAMGRRMPRPGLGLGLAPVLLQHLGGRGGAHAGRAAPVGAAQLLGTRRRCGAACCVVGCVGPGGVLAAQASPLGLLGLHAHAHTPIA